MNSHYGSGEQIEFTNRYGQPATGTVIRQDGDRLTIDYRGVMRVFNIATWTIDDMDLVNDPVSIARRKFDRGDERAWRRVVDGDGEEV